MHRSVDLVHQGNTGEHQLHALNEALEQPVVDQPANAVERRQRKHQAHARQIEPVGQDGNHCLAQGPLQGHGQPDNQVQRDAHRNKRQQPP